MATHYFIAIWIRVNYKVSKSSIVLGNYFQPKLKGQKANSAVALDIRFNIFMSKNSNFVTKILAANRKAHFVGRNGQKRIKNRIQLRLHVGYNIQIGSTYRKTNQTETIL
jgi:hypothetical protein